MSIGLRFAAQSDIGLVRKSNQDAAYASSHLLVLADGMGGAAAGDVASSVTVGYLAAIDDDVHSTDELLPTLRSAVTAAHLDLVERSAENPEISGLGTTCIAILRSGNKLAMVHIGDSRAYLFRDDTMVQVTKDHTLVQFLVDHGQLTPEEAEHHPKRNVIMRALGDAPGPVELDESIREAVQGDRWLLSSDGLFGVVSHDTIEQTLRTEKNLDKCAGRLIDLALAAGAPDNVTVVIADVVADTDTDSQPSEAPIVVGAAALDAGSQSRGGSSPAARAASLFPTPASEDSEDDPADPASAVDIRSRRHRLTARIAAAVAVILVLVGAVVGGYRWTQSQYFVTTDDGWVTIHRGIPQSLGPIHLSSVAEQTGVRASDLLPVAQNRLESPIMRDSLPEARAVVENLVEEMTTPSPSPSPASPSSSISPSPSETQG